MARGRAPEAASPRVRRRAPDGPPRRAGIPVRTSDQTVLETLSGDYWDAGNAGLLAGDRLMLDLHNLERAYLETDDRKHEEFEDSFSLARSDPDALWKLKTEQACGFESRSGTSTWHTRAATTAAASRRSACQSPASSDRTPASARRCASSAATSGRSRAWTRVSRCRCGRRQPWPPASPKATPTKIEFSFRDDRYMPFEGAGVNSRWQLELPSAVKPFDYRTISDVILRISYTARMGYSTSPSRTQHAAWWRSSPIPASNVC